MKNKVIVAAVVLIAVFLAGFLPSYLKASRLENEVQNSRQEIAGAALRDLIALAYVQATQKNFGLAADSTSRFFSRAREVAAQTPDAGRRQALEALAASRDKITAELAKADPAAIGDLQDLYLKTREATRAAPDR